MQPGRRFDRRTVRTRAIHDRGKPASARSSPPSAGVTSSRRQQPPPERARARGRAGTRRPRSGGPMRGDIAKFCKARDDRQLTGRRRATSFRLPAGRRRMGFAGQGGDRPRKPTAAPDVERRRRVAARKCYEGAQISRAVSDDAIDLAAPKIPAQIDARAVPMIVEAPTWDRILGPIRVEESDALPARIAKARIGDAV